MGSSGIIDTHAHLYLEQFNEDIDEVIKRAQANGVHRILLPNIDSSTTASLLSLCKSNPSLFVPMMGLHPCSVSEGTVEAELQHVHEMHAKEPFIAVGEIGIDLYWDKSTLPLQVKAFQNQIELALELNLPIVIHARDSFKEIFEVLDRYNHPQLTGVFHCFTGTAEIRDYILQNYPGFYFGLGGVSTFKNAKMGEVIPDIPLDKVVFETDSPYLAPVPNRGKRNESAYIIEVAQVVADMYQVSLERVKEISTINAVKLFKLSN